MRLIDEKGRLFGRVSVIDLLVVLVVVGLGLGVVYKKTSGEVQQIVSADTKFYVTFKCEKLREFSASAIKEGDVFYKQYDRQPMGPVVKLEVEQGEEILVKTDGTAVLATLADRYTAYVTVECSGSITEVGYYVNGSQHIAEGSEFPIQSKWVLINASTVYAISETLP